MMITSDLRAEVEIWPFRACAMHPAIIIARVRSLWTWLWGRYHVPQNVFLVGHKMLTITRTLSAVFRSSGASISLSKPRQIPFTL